MQRPRTIAVIGGGAWGTALAVHAARCGIETRLWMRERELVTRMRERHDNPVYLPGISVPQGVVPHAELDQALSGVGLVVMVVPSLYARQVYAALAPLVPDGVPVVSAAKGIEEGSLALPLEVARDELGPATPLAVMSGPSFAREVAEGLPTGLVVAAESPQLARELQSALSERAFRLYTNPDPLGVQVAGALKNVMAIAAGVAGGLGLGSNARAALITRALAEMSRLVQALGGRPATSSGLAGMGDLVLTCTGELSRNRSVGERLGHGERLEDILSGTRSVAEGIRTARSARELSRRHGVEMPIVEEVCRILYEDGSPQAGLERLLRRPLTSEAGSAEEESLA